MKYLYEVKSYTKKRVFQGTYYICFFLVMCKKMGMAGVDSVDGRGPVLVVGPGLRSRNRNPVPLIGDNEYGHLGRQSRR
jgi:hypothetical protein